MNRFICKIVLSLLSTESNNGHILRLREIGKLFLRQSIVLICVSARKIDGFFLRQNQDRIIHRAEPPSMMKFNFTRRNANKEPAFSRRSVRKMPIKKLEKI